MNRLNMTNALIRGDHQDVVEDKRIRNRIRVTNGNERGTNKQRSANGNAVIGQQAGQQALPAPLWDLLNSG